MRLLAAVSSNFSVALHFPFVHTHMYVHRPKDIKGKKKVARADKGERVRIVQL